MAFLKIAYITVGEQITVEQLIEKRIVRMTSKAMIMNIGITSVSSVGNVVISKKFLCTCKIMVMHSNERGECVHVPS